jgi:hypothetical protein
VGSYDTGEDAARVYDFAVLSLRGIDTQTAINFDKGAYLGADGALLPVEAALSELGHDEHKYVRGRLAAVVVGGAGDTPGGHGLAPGARQGSAAPRLPLPVQEPGKQQLPPAPPAKYRGGCMRVQAAQRAAVLWCMSVHAHKARHAYGGACTPLTPWHYMPCVRRCAAVQIRAVEGARLRRRQVCVSIRTSVYRIPQHIATLAQTYTHTLSCLFIIPPRALARTREYFLSLHALNLKT